jgi:hypothetical protein
MEVYHLRILPGYNSMYTESVEAQRMVIDNGAYVFYNKEGDRICCYPIRATIVEKIVKV